MKIGLLLPLLCLCFLTQAQDSLSYKVHKSVPLKYEKGTWLVGVQAGYSSAELIGNNLTTHIYGSYFVVDRLSLGLLGTRIQEGITQPINDVSYLAGPVLRYQLTRTRISPFLVIACQVGQRTVTQDESLIITGPHIVSSSGSQTTTTTSNFYIVDPGTRVVYSRSAGVGVSIRAVASLRLDVGITWQDRASTISSGLSNVTGLYQAQFGLNYSLGH